MYISWLLQALKRKQSASLKASRRRRQILDAQRFDQEIQQKEKQEKVVSLTNIFNLESSDF